jgi:V/A-type H+-transporting ATPase subunit I
MGMIKMLCLGGLFTTFWGIMYGSYFGYEWFRPVIVSPMADPLLTLVMCFGFGIVHLVAGLIAKMVACFQDGDWQSAVFDALPWVLILLGAPCFAGSLLGLAWLSKVGEISILLGAGLVVFFSERGTFNPLVRIGKGLYALYGVTGFLSDILSYSRLFALGLCTGVVAMVINTIVGMLSGNILGLIVAAPIFVLGHVVNIGINALGAYVHSSRLQYVEFYGKFFTGGGRLFTPLTPRGKYHQVTDDLEG